MISDRNDRILNELPGHNKEDEAPSPTSPFVRPCKDKTRPDLLGTFGMAASTHWLATGVAQSVLERGGNAFDAAVAAAFMLFVVEPNQTSPGGEVVAIFVTATDKTPKVLAGQGPAPAAATPDHFRAEGLDIVPHQGALATAVPGAVDAWLLLLRDHGTWELADVLAFAISYARNGHPVSSVVVNQIASMVDLFRDHWPTSAALWMPSGKVPAPGELIKNEALADVLDLLVAAGSGANGRVERINAARTEWSEGLVAQAIDNFVRKPHWHTPGTNHAGVIRASDLASFRASYEPATTATFRGYTIAKTGPWGQGPVLLQALRILEPLEDQLMDPSTVIGAHTIVETIKLVMADREAFYGDRDVPMDVLLSDDYADTRREMISDEASAELRPGTVPGFDHAFPPLRTSNSSEGRSGDTCHIDVVDRWGNMISATPSGGWLQSSPTIPELGFCLNNRLQMTWLEVGTASTMSPGRRPRTTLSPTLVLRDGTPIAALGSIGGDNQDQWQLLFLLRWIVGGYTPQEAIDAPAFHSRSCPESLWPRTWEPAGLVVEDRLGDDVIEGLSARGHVITQEGDWGSGRLSCVTLDPHTGVLGAAANSRGAQGYASGR